MVRTALASKGAGSMAGWELRSHMLYSMAKSLIIIIIKHWRGNIDWEQKRPPTEEEKCANFNVRTSVHEIIR